MEKSGEMQILTDNTEIVLDEEEQSMDYKSIDYVLQNLKIASEDIFQDDSNVTQARVNIATTISHQISYYCACALQPFSLRRKTPCIVVFGAEGFVGSKAILQLISYGLTQFITVFSRSLLASEYWKAKYIKVVDSFSHFHPGEKVDIVIDCADIASFPSICTVLEPVVNAGTVYIFSSLGLQRKRVFNTLKVACVLKTFQEHEHGMSAAKKAAGKDSEAYLGSDLSPEAYAADMIARRCTDIRHMIFVLENNFVIKGLTPVVARHRAMTSLLGKEALGLSLPPTAQSGMSGGAHHPHSARYRSRDNVIRILEYMQPLILDPFQTQFSKYIKVMDLPDLGELAVRVDAPEPLNNDNLLMNLEYHLTGRQTTAGLDDDDISQQESVSASAAFEMIFGPKSEESSVLTKQSGASSTGTSLSKAEIMMKRMERSRRNSHSSQNNSRIDPFAGMGGDLAAGGLDPDKAHDLHAQIKKRKEALELSKRHKDEDMYSIAHPPMHEEIVIGRIYDDDMKSAGTLLLIPEQLSKMMADMDAADDLDEDIDIVDSMTVLFEVVAEPEFNASSGLSELGVSGGFESGAPRTPPSRPGTSGVPSRPSTGPRSAAFSRPGTATFQEEYVDDFQFGLGTDFSAPLATGTDTLRLGGRTKTLREADLDLTSQSMSFQKVEAKDMQDTIKSKPNAVEVLVDPKSHKGVVSVLVHRIKERVLRFEDDKLIAQREGDEDGLDMQSALTAVTEVSSATGTMDDSSFGSKSIKSKKSAASSKSRLLVESLPLSTVSIKSMAKSTKSAASKGSSTSKKSVASVKSTTSSLTADSFGKKAARSSKL